MQKYRRFGETPVLRTRPWVEDAAPQNPLPHLWRSGYGARNTRRKAVEGNADPTTRQTSPIKNLPHATGVAGAGRKGSRTCRRPPVWRGGQERLYGKPITEKVLWRGDGLWWLGKIRPYLNIYLIPKIVFVIRVYFHRAPMAGLSCLCRLW